MDLKRWLIIGFAVLSALTVWDAARSGPDLIRDSLYAAFPEPRLASERPPDTPAHTFGGGLEPIEGPVSELAVMDFFGALEVTRSETGTLTAAYELRIWSRDEETAKVLAEQIEVEWRGEGDRKILAVKRPEIIPDGIYDVRLSVDVKVPADVDLRVSSLGEVNVHDLRGAVEISHTGSSLSVRNVRGPVSVTTNFGNSTLHNVDGPLEVELFGGHVDIERVTGDVSGRIRSASTEVDDIQGDVRLDLAQGNTAISTVDGDLDIHSRYGSLRVDEVDGAARIDSEYGTLRLNDPRGDVDVTSDFGNAFVRIDESLGWTVDAEAESGNLRSVFDLETIKGERITQAEGTIGDGSRTLRLRSRMGNIILSALE